MSLEHCSATFYDAKVPNFHEPQKGVKIDYHFSAKRQQKGSDQIYLRVWIFIWDSQGYLFQQFSSHMGHFDGWQEVIKQQIRKCLAKFGVEKVQQNGILREFEVSKANLLKWEQENYGIMNYEAKRPDKFS